MPRTGRSQSTKRGYPDAAASLREGLAEMFTVNQLGLSPALCRCLSSRNIIESPDRRVRLRTRRICRWRDGKMVLRWAAAAFLITEQSFRKIQGYRDVWMLPFVALPQPTGPFLAIEFSGKLAFESDPA